MSDCIAIRTYKYLLKPSREQQATLHGMLQVACDLYNHALEHRRKRWQESRHAVTYVEQAKLLTLWRNEDKDHNPLHAFGVTAAQQVLRRLDRAYREFLKGTRGHPRQRPCHLDIPMHNLALPATLFRATVTGHTPRTRRVLRRSASTSPHPQTLGRRGIAA